MTTPNRTEIAFNSDLERVAFGLMDLRDALYAMAEAPNPATARVLASYANDLVVLCEHMPELGKVSLLIEQDAPEALPVERVAKSAQWLRTAGAPDRYQGKTDAEVVASFLNTH